MTVKNNDEAFRRGYMKAFDSFMKNQKFKPSIKDKVQSRLSPDFLLNYKMGAFRGQDAGEEAKRALRRNELLELVHTQTLMKKIERNITR